MTSIDQETVPPFLLSDPAERILARRLRRERRTKLESDKILDENVEIEQTETEKQILASSDLLNTLTTEGDEVIKNIRIANEAKELARQKNDRDIRNKLSMRLEENAEQCTKEYKEINERWESILSSKDPLEIHSELKAQNEKCLQVIAMKDAVIAELKEELSNADIKYVNDQKKQNEDIDLLIDRIDNQVNVINKGYSQELSKIDEALECERKDLLEHVSKKWNALYNRCRQDNLNGIEMRKEIVRKYDAEIEKLIQDHHKEYREQKMRLDTEYQNLQKQFEHTKALCDLNIEKLNFSYATLKRREDENVIIANCQRKRLNKLQENVNELKKTFSTIKQSSQIKKQKIKDQIEKLRKNSMDLAKKSNHFAEVSEKQYFQIWDMNTKDANQLLAEILTMDKELYEEFLGVEWKPPNLPLLTKEELPSYCEAKKLLEQKESDKKAELEAHQSIGVPNNLEEINLERRLLNHVLKLISNASGIFMEDGLRILLETYSEADNVIIKLDSVFQALDVTKDEDIKMLLKFFIPYLHCSTCATIAEETSNASSSTFDGLSSKSDEDICVGVREREEKLIKTVLEVMDETPGRSDDISFSCKSSTSGAEQNDIVTCSINEEENKTEIVTELNSSLKQKLTCSKGHTLEMQTTHVFAALKEFVVKHSENTNLTDHSIFQRKTVERKFTISRNLSLDDVTKYWARYREVFSPKKEELWDALLIGLNKYYDILKERQKITEDIEKLKKQNSELCHLLQVHSSAASASDKKLTMKSC